MKWIYVLVIGAVIVLLGYFIVTSMQSPSSSYVGPSTSYSIGGNTYPSSPSNPMTNPQVQNSIEIPVQTQRPVAPMTAQPVTTGILYSTPSQPSVAVVKGTGQYAGDKWITMGPAQGTHIQAT